MSQAESAAAYVYEGAWTNWSKGRHLGATLTLSPRDALLVVSVLALFVGLAGTQLWKIIQFIVHQSRATAYDRDGLYHQQQVILRNSSSELGACWNLVRVAFAWRTQKRVHSYRRSAALVALPLLHFAFFTLAGVFASRLLDAGDQVLSRSPYCGDYNVTYISSLGTSTIPGSPNRLVNDYAVNAQNQLQRSQQYVQFCSDPLVPCRELPHSALKWASTVSTQCPFDSKVCSQTSNQSVVVDSGLISSHRHLGLNAPVKDRIQYRKVTTCTILNDAQYISDWKDIPATESSPAKRVVDAYYGPNPIADRNATYSYSEWNQYYSYDQYSTTNPYQLNVQFAVASDTTGTVSDFIPIPELSRTDGDVDLLFLSFSKVYDAPVNDPWYSAQIPSSYPTHDNINAINRTVYVRERPVITMACVEQHQLCIESDDPAATPDPQRCTPLGGSMQTQYTVDALNLTARQVATATRVFNAAKDSLIYMVTSGLTQRDTPLLARREIQGLLGLQLPDDQWLKEIDYWNKISMTHLQRSVINYATGQFAADTSYINTTLSPWNKWLCQNQIIRGTRYQSFNLLTMIIVLVFGTLIIVAGYTIEDCVAIWRRRDKRGDQGSVRRDMWAMNEMLEMLSLLFAVGGRTKWSHSSNGIPVAAPGQLMNIRDLDIQSAAPQDLSEKELQQVRSKFTSETDVWQPYLMTDSSSTFVASGPASKRTGIDASNTFDFSSSVSTPNLGVNHGTTQPDLSDARGAVGHGNADDFAEGWNDYEEPANTWGEAPRSPPPAPLRSPFRRHPSWYGRAY